MDKIGKLLMGNMAKKGIAGAALGAQVCYFAEKWGKGRFSAVSLSRGILKLSVRTSCAAQDLSMQEEELVNHLNEKIGKNIVKRIRIINIS